MHLIFLEELANDEVSAKKNEPVDGKTVMLMTQVTWMVVHGELSMQTFFTCWPHLNATIAPVM